MQAVNEKWGEDYLQRAGRESIAGPVCKKKYVSGVLDGVFIDYRDRSTYFFRKYSITHSTCVFLCHGNRLLLFFQ
jgi:hypothetical protein